MLKQVNGNKTADLDCAPGRVLKTCAEQLTEVFSQTCHCSNVPEILRHHSCALEITCKALVNCSPVALTPVVMKCFERLVLSNIRSIIPPDLDSHQFAYQANHSAEDAVNPALTQTELLCENAICGLELRF